MTDDALLSLRNLRVELAPKRRRGAPRTVIHDVSLTVGPGESVGLVGESGSGKSMTTRAITRLLPAGARAHGSILAGGEEVLTMTERQVAVYRSRAVSMIYQDPRAAINPMRTIGDFLVEGVVSTGLMSQSDAISRARKLLEDVGIHNSAARMEQYPHQLSGGLLQRIMIAMALMPSPGLILADEPTTALDVTVQSEVMAILREQITTRGVGLLLITHDLDLAAAVTDTLAVMYAGMIVETGPSEELYARPRHPYTAGLLTSRPSIERAERLISIPGRPMSAFEVGAGCVFADRCAFAAPQCIQSRPQLREVDGHLVACHRAEEIKDDPRMQVVI